MPFNCGVGEDSWESLGLQRSNQSILKAISPEYSLEAETPILWPCDENNWLTGEDPDAGKDWRWEEKGTTEDEMVEWHHWLNGHEFESTPAVGDGQGGLVCCRPWGCKESDTTQWLNWAELKVKWGHTCGPTSSMIGVFIKNSGLGQCTVERWCEERGRIWLCISRRERSQKKSILWTP